MNSTEKNKLVWNAVPTILSVPNPPPDITPSPKREHHRDVKSGIEGSTSRLSEKSETQSAVSHHEQDVKLCMNLWKEARVTYPGGRLIPKMADQTPMKKRVGDHCSAIACTDAQNNFAGKSPFPKDAESSRRKPMNKPPKKRLSEEENSEVLPCKRTKWSNSSAEHTAEQMAADRWTRSDDVLRAGSHVNITLTLKQDVFNYWQKVGATEGLTDNDQIASFLLQRYQKSRDGVQVTFTCVHCHQPLSVKIKNTGVLRGKQPGTSCVHGKNGLRQTSASPLEAADHRQEENVTADVLSAGKSGGHLPLFAAGKQCFAMNNSARATDVKTEPEIANQPTGFGDWRDASEASAVMKDGTSETDTLHIKPDPDCTMSSEFQGQGGCRQDNTTMELCSPLAQAHNMPEGEQGSIGSTVTSGRSDCGQLESSQIATGTDQTYASPLAHNTPDKEQAVGVSTVMVAASDSNQFEWSQIPSQTVTGNAQIYTSNENTSQTLLEGVNRNMKTASCKICRKVFNQSALQAHDKKCSKKPFICSYCSLAFVSCDLLLGHMQCHTGQQPYCCKACEATFNERSSLKDHIQNVHTHDAKFLCFECGASFKNSCRLKAHLKSYVCAYRFQCDRCDQAFITPKDLNEHLREHAKEKSESALSNEDEHEYASNEDQPKYTCSICSKTFMYALQLTVHLGTHTDKTYYHFKCQMCGEDFETLDSLKEHILAQHPDEKSHTCDTCQTSFKSAERLKFHLKTHTKPYVCKDCNTAFATSFQLRCHSRTHTGEKPFACDQCPSTFHTKQLLRVHLKQHTGIKPYMCEECGKAFVYRERLIRHRLVHTGERPYVCEFCGAAFRQKTNMDTHKLRHRADSSCKRAPRPKKNFKCLVCSSVLSTKRTYDDHMMRHTGERPYKCSHCDAAYIIKFQLKMHMKKHHSATLALAMSDSLSPKKSADAELKK